MKKILKHNIIIFFIIFFLLLATNQTTMAANKKSTLTFTNTSISLNSGDTKELLPNLPKGMGESYTLYWYSSDSSIVSVDEYGIVTAKVPGKATITLEIYEDYFNFYSPPSYRATCEVIVSQSDYSLPIHEITLLEGETYSLTLPGNVSYTYETDSYGLFITNDPYNSNILSIYSRYPTTTSFTITFYDGFRNIIGMDRCDITVLKKGLAEDDFCLATGSTYHLQVNGYDTNQILQWTSTNPTIATVDSNGLITATQVGKTDIELMTVDMYGSINTYRLTLEVTNPIFNTTNYNLAVGQSLELDLQGTSYYSSYEIKPNKEGIVDSYNTTIYGIKKGKTTLNVCVDGRSYTLNVSVTNPSIKQSHLLIKKGEKLSIKVKGVNSDSVITYQSQDKSIATVSNTGTIKAKKVGSTVITIEADGKILHCTISIGNQKAISALTNATNALGSAYSQEKRMQEGYYDCSSLIWRSWAPTGITFGSTNWAPTAAGIAQYLVNNNKVLSYEYLPANQLQPGDLLFFSRGDNGRFMNIYHVAMYYGVSSSTQHMYYQGSYDTTGLLIEADGSSVSLNPYYVYPPGTQGRRQIALIARPTS